MAKTATEETAVQKAATAAREAYKKAKDVAKLSKKPEDEKTAATAKTTMDNAIVAERRERFIKFAEIRTGNVIKALKALGSTNTQASYKYDQTDIDKIFVAVDKTALDAKTALSEALRGGTTAVPSLFKLV